MELSGYSLDPLREDGEFILYRAHAKQIEAPSVLVLAPVSSRPGPETLKKIDHEYSLRSELDAMWAVRPLALSQQDEQMTLVLEDPGGETLDRFLPGPLEMTWFLRLAIGTATALSGVHKRELIHKDVKPANVLVNSATGQVRLMGFGIASRLPREHLSPEAPELIAGTLPYMAPEQTGRMNRSIDSRSDLYSLGVTLYEMLTGSLPFTASDPMEWVHCHIARRSLPPGERAPNIPGPVSAVIMKLLAKTAEERYQTAVGLDRDLRRCLKEWETLGRIDEFPLGEHDTPDRLSIPEKLYGRASEINTLLASFNRVVAGGRPELVLVSGYSGVGKSSVVNELHKPLVPPRGLFASGKFDQYKRDIPYATLAQAFQSLLRPILAKNEEELGRWRDAIREALGPNGQLMVDLVPELELIIGEQPPVSELPPQDARSRFQLVFRRFISVFTREHPLALFLDDLQWLDAATLDLMEDLLTRPDVQRLMLIGAYRDNEVNSTHPLMRKLEAMRQAGAILQNIVLAPLTRDDLVELIADSLHCERGRAGPLAELVEEKTTGNPFFAIQFISALFEEGLLIFDHVEGQWCWDLNRIHSKGYTDNVVDLMLGKLNRLPIRTQKALQQLACLGNIAPIVTFAIVHGTSEEQARSDLWEAIRQGFIINLGSAYKFAHDRVQEATYAMVPPESRAQAHLRIARLLTAQTPADQLEKAIFDIVNQFNRAAALITSPEEREQVAQLNLHAGERAKNSAAYRSALNYFIAGAVLLAEECWQRQRKIAFPLELYRAECEFLCGDIDAAAERLTALSTRAANSVEHAAVACLAVDVFSGRSQIDRAVAVCLDYMRYVGVEWSAHPTDEEVRDEYDHVWLQLGGREIEDLIELPLMHDPASLATLNVLTKAVLPALLTDTNLLYLVTCKAVNLSLQQGYSDGSCFAYVYFGTVTGHFGDYQAGFRFGRLGFDLVERRGPTRFQDATYLCFGLQVMPWTKHIRACRDPLRNAFEIASRVGDLNIAIYCHPHLNTNLIAAGDPLSHAQREAEKGLEFAQQARFAFVADQISSQLGLIRTLRGMAPQFGSFDDGQFDELQFEGRFAARPGLSVVECWYWIRKLQARFFAGDYAAALDASSKAKPLLWSSPSTFEQAEYEFYSALAQAACCDFASPGRSMEHLQTLASHHKQLEIWTQHCPENFENRAALVGAEIARIDGRVLEAEQLYEQAIRSAHSNGFVNNEAIAYELAARFYAARGFQKFADAYLLEARYCYQRWGADGKVAQLNHLYPHLKKEGPPISTPASAILAPAELLDLATVIGVSQAVAGEMVLEKLIDRLMRAALEQAGAERALLIVPRRDALQIEAEAITTQGDVTVHQRDGADTAGAMPESLVRYVMRTQETVILEDASSQNPFSADPYIIQRRPRSILTLPLINQGKLISILHLENNLTPHVFTPDRITVLKVLASQAAISLENTRLYRDLEDRERRIRRLVDANILGIFIWELEGSIVEANEAFLHMLHYGREDLASGRVHWRDLTPLEWRECDERALAALKATGTVQPYQKEYFRKDGSRVPVLVGGALFKEGGNDGVAFVLDLSEQMRTEEALRRSERYLAQAQRLAHIGSWAWQAPGGNALYLSAEWYRLCGFDPKDGMPTWEQRLQGIHPEDRARVQATTDRAIAQKSDYEMEFRIVAPHMPIRFIHSVGQPVMNASGELLQFVGVMMDVTARKYAEQEQERLRQELAHLAHLSRVSTMGELVASISHELAQPIQITTAHAKASLRWLQRDPPEVAEARKGTEKIIEAGALASEIISRLRSLYKLAPPKQELVAINEVVGEMVGMMRGEARGHGVSIRTDLKDDLPMTVADRVQLQQVLMNLMLNGIEAMKDTAGLLMVKSQLREDGQIEISVSDTGPGLPLGKADQIFDAFFTTKPQGSGMGLAISKSIVESQGGRIWANGDGGRGATFHFTLPVAPAETNPPVDAA